MSLLRAITSGLGSLFRKEQVDRELDEELRGFLQMAVEEKMKQGMSRKDALRAVRLERGSLDVAKEEVRSAGWESYAETVGRDLHFALRQWTKNPGFALSAVVVLALGMGVSLTIFRFVDAALLQPLPYASPERLMSVNESNAESPRWPLSYPDYLDWQRLNKSFRSLDIYNGSGYLLQTPSGATAVQGERVSGGFFQTLGVRPMLGRDFSLDEDRPGGPNVAILSYGAWLHHFGARRDVVGLTVNLDNAAYTIIGVLPRTFSFARAGDAEFWVPINTLSPHEQMRTFYNFWGIGRLRDGVTAREALAEMSAISKQLQMQFPTSDRSESASVVPLSEVILGDVRPILLTLLGGAGLLLLIACVNVTSLVLVRSENRRGEIAVRGALGISVATGAAIRHGSTVACHTRQSKRRDICRLAHDNSVAPSAQRHGGGHAFSGRCGLEYSYVRICRHDCIDGRGAVHSGSYSSPDFAAGRRRIGERGPQFCKSALAETRSKNGGRGTGGRCGTFDWRGLAGAEPVSAAARTVGI